MSSIVWLSDTGKENISKVGSKAGYLGELKNLNLEIPTGFIVTTDVYEKFLREKKDRIMEILTRTDVNNKDDLSTSYEETSNIFLSSKLEDKVKKEIEEAYNNLVVSDEAKEAGGKALEMIKAGRDRPKVSVRVSLPNNFSKASFAGLHRNFLDIKGKDELIECIKKAWLSVFSPEAIFYREKKHIPHDLDVAIIVQMMNKVDKGGRALTFNPVNGKEELVIESVEGNGKKLGDGKVTPSLLIFDKRTGEIKKRDGNLSENEIQRLLECLKKINEKFNRPQEVEWGFSRGKLKLFQTRELLGSEPKPEEKERNEFLLEGIGVSPGKAKGKAINIYNIDENSDINRILITRSLNSELIKIMDKVKGIISEKGGITSSISHIAREFNLPTLVAEGLREKIKPNSTVLLDPINNKVYSEEKEKIVEREMERKFEDVKFTPTATELKMTIEDLKVKLPNLETSTSEDLDEPSLIKEVDGVVILQPKEEYGIERYDYGRKSSIEKVSKLTYPREIWLKLDNVDESEHSFIRRLHSKGMDNIHLLFSSIKVLDDFIHLKNDMRSASLPSSVKRGVMIETPASALEIKKFCEKGIDFVCIDFEKLSQLTIGTEEIKSLHPSVMDLIKKIVNSCNKYEVHSSIHLKEINKDIINKIVEMGLDSISTSKKYIKYTSKQIERSERKMLLERMRSQK